MNDNIATTDGTDASATRTHEFELLRPRLFGVAYRMTGSVADADDICQEAWLRWRRVELATITSPEGFLVRTVTNLALDLLRSAHQTRETYVGAFLPEPLVGGDNDPAADAELADSLTFAFLVMLDELSPIERAVLLLHDVYGYPFREISPAVDRSAEACRQIASRTRRKLQDQPELFRRPDAADEARVVEQLLAATATGDVARVMELLAPDVVQLGDGGPNRHAARRPILGADRVARVLVNLAKRGAATHYGIEPARVNGDPGLVFTLDGHVDIVMSFSLAPDRRVRRIYVQLNPDKLKHLTP